MSSHRLTNIMFSGNSHYSENRNTIETDDSEENNPVLNQNSIYEDQFPEENKVKNILYAPKKKLNNCGYVVSTDEQGIRILCNEYTRQILCINHRYVNIGNTRRKLSFKN